MKQVTIHSDGGCEGNPGPGGWAAVLEFGERKKEISGGAPATTNNRMELQAAISALEALKEPCHIVFFTDSQYLRNGITEWVRGWKAKGWKLANKSPVKNDDLWRRLDSLASGHRIEWKWLKGHAGHLLNERCDLLAQNEIAAIKKRYTPDQLNTLVAEFQSSRVPSVPDLFN